MYTVTTDRIAEIFGIDIQTVRVHVRNGRFGNRAIKVSNKIMFDEKLPRQLIAEIEKNPTLSAPKIIASVCNTGRDSANRTILNAAETAFELGVTPSTLRKYIAQGIIAPLPRDTTQIKFSAQEVARFKSEQYVRPFGEERKRIIGHLVNKARALMSTGRLDKIAANMDGILAKTDYALSASDDEIEKMIQEELRA